MSTFTDNTKRPVTTAPIDATRPAQTNGTRTTTVLTSDCEFKGGALTVGEQALIKAEIKVNDVLIYGKVQGNIFATGRIELRGKAEVYGDLHSNRLAMDDGVVFVGRSNGLNGKTTPASDFAKMFTRLGASAAAKPGATPAASSTKD